MFSECLPHAQTTFTFWTVSHCFLIQSNHALGTTGQIMQQVGHLTARLSQASRRSTCRMCTVCVFLLLGCKPAQVFSPGTLAGCGPILPQNGCNFRLPSSGLSCGPTPTSPTQLIQFTITIWTRGSCGCCCGLLGFSQVKSRRSSNQARLLFVLFCAVLFSSMTIKQHLFLSSTCRVVFVGQLSPLLLSLCPQLLVTGTLLLASARQSFLFFLTDYFYAYMCPMCIPGGRGG